MIIISNTKVKAMRLNNVLKTLEHIYVIREMILKNLANGKFI